MYHDIIVINTLYITAQNRETTLYGYFGRYFIKTLLLLLPQNKIIVWLWSWSWLPYTTNPSFKGLKYRLLISFAAFAQNFQNCA